MYNFVEYQLSHSQICPSFLSYQHFPNLPTFEALECPKDLCGHHGKMEFVSFLVIGKILSWENTRYIFYNMESSASVV